MYSSGSSNTSAPPGAAAPASRATGARGRTPTAASAERTTGTRAARSAPRPTGERRRLSRRHWAGPSTSAAYIPSSATVNPTARSVRASRPTPGRSVQSPHEAGSALGGTSPFHSTTSAASGTSARPSAAPPTARCAAPPCRAALGPPRPQHRRDQEARRHRDQPQERLPRQHGRPDRQAGHGEHPERATARVRVYALQGDQREQDRQVVREQRERGAEHVRRQHERERQRERGRPAERRGAPQQPQQRQGHPVRDRHVQQPQLPELESDHLAPARSDQVVERRLRRRVVGQVEPLAQLEDRRQLVDPRVAAVERVDLDREPLQHGYADQERHRQQDPVEHQPSGSGRGGRSRGATSTATIAAMMSPAPSQPAAVSRSSFSSQPNRPANAGSEARISAVRAGGACFCANDCTKNPSALATSDVTSRADHTVAPSGGSSCPATAAMASETNPTTPSCTASSAPTSKRRTALAVARMCAASENAHRSTSPSPRRSNSPPAPDSSQRPSMATPAATQAVLEVRWPRKTAPSTGVSTTNRPVMKPVLEALVSSSPRVWKM